MLILSNLYLHQYVEYANKDQLKNHDIYFEFRRAFKRQIFSIYSMTSNGKQDS